MLGLVIFVLGLSGVLEATEQQIPVANPSHDNPHCLETLPNVPEGQKSPLVEKHRTRLQAT